MRAAFVEPGWRLEDLELQPVTRQYPQRATIFAANETLGALDSLDCVGRIAEPSKWERKTRPYRKSSLT